MPKKPPSPVLGVPSLAEIRAIAADSENIVTHLRTVQQKARRRQISRRQIELCCQRGTIQEGPFLNERGDWQVTMYRHAAGEELRVVIVISDGVLIVRSNH